MNKLSDAELACALHDRDPLRQRIAKQLAETMRENEQFKNSLKVLSFYADELNYRATSVGSAMSYDMGRRARELIDVCAGEKHSKQRKKYDDV